MRGGLRIAALAATVLAGAAHAADPVLEMKASQIEALGIQTKPALAVAAGAARALPSTVLVPNKQLRVIASPVPGVVESLQATIGDAVRAGQVLAVLRSPQAQELQRDALSTAGQATLARSVLTRDEALYREGLIPESRLESTRAQARQAQLMQQDRRRAQTEAGAAAGGANGVVSLKAPIDGVVLEQKVVVGERVDRAVVLFRIGKLAPLWLEIQVPVDDATAVRVGDAVQLADGSASGRVIGVAPMVDDTSQTVIVRAELPKPPAGLRIGQAVEVRIESARPGLVQVPATAVFEQGGGAAVFVEVAPGRFQAARVQSTGSAEGLASITGLAVGTRVVTQGTAALKAVAASARP